MLRAYPTLAIIAWALAGAGSLEIVAYCCSIIALAMFIDFLLWTKDMRLISLSLRDLVSESSSLSTSESRDTFSGLGGF
jgi:predicted nucleic acid-binding protein